MITREEREQMEYMCKCDYCKHKDLMWYEEPCDSCTVGGKNDHYEVKNEQQT